MIIALTKLSEPVQHQHTADATHLHKNAKCNRQQNCNMLDTLRRRKQFLTIFNDVTVHALCRRKCSVMLRQQNVMNDITMMQCSAILHLHADTVLT